MTFDTHLPLNERLMRIDHIQARRYSKLTGLALEIATEGIIRHLKACDRMDVNPETSAVREIIDDALNGREWLVGKKFSVADINVSTVVGMTQWSKIDISYAKNVSAWLARCMARPARNPAARE